MMNKKLLVSITILAVTGSMVAGELPRDTVKLDELLVTAPLKMDVDLIPLNVTEITSEEIERSAESSLLPLLEAKVPGLFVTERGFEGYGLSTASQGAGQVYIRGVGDGNKVLFMIDGQPQWAGVFGHSLADTYVANGVERVEVVKGPSSLLYGSNAMAGSINLITRTQRKDGLTGRARAMFGSFNTQKFAVSSGYKKGKFSATLAGQLDRSNGNRANSDYWMANEFAQLKYAMSDKWSVAGMLDMTQSYSNYPGAEQAPRENTWSDISRATAGVYLKNQYDKMDGGVQAYVNWGRHKIDDGNVIGTAPTDYLFNSSDYNMGFTAYESFNLWDANVLSAGVDFQHWGGRIWNINKEDESIRTSEETHHVNEIAGYVMMQQGFFNDIINVNGGVRLQHGTTYGNVWVPQAGLIVKPTNTSQIKASFSKGFRSPNIRELYLYPPKNSDLKPEYMLNYEISYRQHLLNYRLMLGAAIFYIDAKNIIQMGAVDGSRRWLNTGKFHNKGFEIEVSYDVLSNLQASASWAYLHSDSKANLYTPKNKLNAEVTYSPGNFSFTLEEMSIWSMKNGNPDGNTIDYSLLNLRAAYTLESSVPVTLFVKVDNITNSHYQIIYGFPMPGTTIMGGVEFRF